MNICVGIPQALLHHEFGRLWLAFFQRMGVPTVESGATTKSVLDRGTSHAIDESCLPLKVYLGHVDCLLTACSHIFVPRIAQYHPNYYLCAKFAGLPDIVQNTFRLPPNRLISPNIEDSSVASQLKAVHSTCKALGLPSIKGLNVYCDALAEWRNQPKLESNSQAGDKKIAIIGHSYIIEDTYFISDIISPLLLRGVTIVTPKNVPNKELYEEAKEFQSDIYWQLSAKLAGATKFFCRQSDVSGIILVSSFGCGPDSLVNEYLEHHVLTQSDKPYIILSIDEHTGTAGITTRVEAFWDMVERRLSS